VSVSVVDLAIAFDALEPPAIDRAIVVDHAEVAGAVA
jgi:hypothetical protein